MLIERTKTANGDARTTTTGRARHVGDINARHAALQQIFNAGRRRLLQILNLHRSDGPHLLARVAFAIGNHRHLADGIGRSRQHNVHRLAGRVVQSFRFITHTRHRHVARLLIDGHGEFSIGIGCGALRRAFYLQRSKWHRLARFVFHHTLQREFSLHGLLHLIHLDALSLHAIGERRVGQQPFHGTQLVNIFQRDGEQQRVVLHIVGIVNGIIALFSEKIEDGRHRLILKRDGKMFAHHLCLRIDNRCEQQSDKANKRKEQRTSLHNGFGIIIHYVLFCSNESAFEVMCWC